MTVLSEANRYSATSSGSLGPYTIGYVVIDEDDIAVYVGGVLKTIATHYTVANAGTSSSATVTFTSGNAPASGAQIVVVRAVELVQLYNPANGDSFDSEALEGTIDRIYHGLHELGDKNDGTIKFSVALSGATGFATDSAAAGTVTANKAARINKGLMFDADGNITVTDENPNEQITLATAQAVLASGSASAASGSAGTSAADAIATAADVVLTHADVVLTNADVVLAEADKVQTGLDRIAVAADLVLTNADVVLAEADKVQTGLDRVATAADVVLAEADKVQTGLDRVATAADVVATNADVVSTNADVVLTNADVVSSSGSASAAAVSATAAASASIVYAIALG